MPAESAKNLLLWLLKPFYSRDRQYWKVVLLCFIAASTFWLLNALNKSYTNIRTSYPLQFAYDPQKFIPLKPLPEEIEINVSGKGWKLLRKYLMLNVRPVEIFIQSIPRRDYLTGQALRANAAGVLDGLQLNFVLTDTVHFSFDRRINRKIPLAVDSSKIKIADNVYIASPLEVNPDSVLFDGPASIVDSFPSPFPVVLPANKIDRSFKRFLPLEYPNTSLVTASVPDVEVSFAVSPLTWQQLIITPAMINLPAGKELVLQPAAVTLTYGYGQRNAPAITPDQFEAVLDYNTLNPEDSTVAVVLVRKPKPVKHVNVQPSRVKLLPAS